MKEYGYVTEEGYLRSRLLSVLEEAYRSEESGEIEMRKVSIEEQAKALVKEGFKPVDEIDESKRVCAPGFYIKIIPFDAGDRISYEYVKIHDKQALRGQIRERKELLEQEDYKIIKSYEASLLGLEAPYDMEELHAKRQTIRNEINELEKLINKDSS